MWSLLWGMYIQTCAGTCVCVACRCGGQRTTPGSILFHSFFKTESLISNCLCPHSKVLELRTTLFLAFSNIGSRKQT